MKKMYYACLLMALIAFNTSGLAAKEITFNLEPHQKTMATYSGDIDQKSSVHLVLYKDKQLDNFGIRPFFIDGQENITSFSEINFQEQPSIVSYHFDPSSLELTLLVQQRKKRDYGLEIIDLNVLSKKISRSTIDDYERPYLIMRAQENTFLVYKDKKALRISTIKNSNNRKETKFKFRGDDLDQYKEIFKYVPEYVNTQEYVEHGSIGAAKAYVQGKKLIFDYRDDGKYINLSLDPDNHVTFSFQEISFEDIKKVKDITTYVYDSKIFLFINDKEDIHLRSYDLGTGKLLTDVGLQENLSDYLNPEVLEKLIRKSKRNKWGLTGTVNAGPEKTMVINMDYVLLKNYNYHHNWWWHHQFLQQHMMIQQQMMRTHMQMQMQMNSFGPDPGNHIPIDLAIEDNQSIQLVIDQDLNVVKAKEPKTLRPQIAKEKYIEPYQEDRKIKDLSMAFTNGTGRTIYYSKKTDAFHVEIFDL